MKAALKLTSFILLLALARSVLADIAIIANPSLELDTMTAQEASMLFLGKTKTLTNGVKPRILDLPDGNDLKTHFYYSLTGKSPYQLHSYWARMLFSGQATYVPIPVDNVEQVLLSVASTKNAIGYVNVEDVNDSVKVLMTVKGKEKTE